MAEEHPEEWLDVIIYMLSFISIHSCTCSCLTSAMLYRYGNVLSDDDIVGWAKRYPKLLLLPFQKL